MSAHQRYYYFRYSLPKCHLAVNVAARWRLRAKKVDVKNFFPILWYLQMGCQMTASVCQNKRVFHYMDINQRVNEVYWPSYGWMGLLYWIFIRKYRSARKKSSKYWPKNRESWSLYSSIFEIKCVSLRLTDPPPRKLKSGYAPAIN